jgi:formamidopyrimidine-DNA glycosylase
MPELPEVQTVVSDLQKILPGKKITGIWVGWSKLIKIPKTVTLFKKELIGKKFLSTQRVGKNVLISLSDNTTLLIHQKMTGHMLYGKWSQKGSNWESMEEGPHKEDPYNRFIRLIFFLSNGKHLALCDMRKFAKVLIWPTDKLSELKDINKLGPDPTNKSFDYKKFKDVLTNKKGKVKFVLMDQNVIAGIGNIYADEILWTAGVHPFKEVKKLTEIELKKIFKAIKPILQKSIKARGTSSSDFRDASGKKGSFQKFLKVYQKKGEKCAKKDGGIIERVKSNGRSSHFCPVHQKL